MGVMPVPPAIMDTSSALTYSKQNKLHGKEVIDKKL
jgi:hypothetical protein